MVYEIWSPIPSPIRPCPMIFLNSPEYVQKLLNSSESAHLGKSFAYNPCKPFWHDGLIISKGDKWKSRRKLLTHIVTFKNLQSYMDIYNKESISLVKKLDDHFSHCPKNKAKTIDELLMTSSLNIIMEAAMGTDITKMTAAGDKSFVESVNTCMEIVVTRVLNPWLMIDWIWKLHPMSKYGFEVVSSARQYVRQTMEQNKKGKLDGEQTSLIEDLQEAGLTEEEITGEVFTIISAGYETTATTIHFLLFLLSLHPNHQELCRDEIDTVFDDPELCPGGNLTNAAFGKLKHLERCIQETLRFYPVVPVFQRHIEAPLELEKGVVIPANSVVTLFPQGIHMNPKYFPEPEKFNPDRFSIEEVKARPPFAYIPFSAGTQEVFGVQVCDAGSDELECENFEEFCGDHERYLG
ncbi:Cytochrome P450 4V2 [Orchesella cincta]|uniref:Cytochrome P450 4V2 n=1 Tax=Orchesella cincta TaxID=48709 RepID=A0A1D2MAH1_ORCCI|nr:Cytochrome P450 4V2 [Orchesella cincta]